MASEISNKRIAKNTLVLYVRNILILLVSLYSVRLLLNILGVEDYGIYNVVGGIVMFFSFLSGTMASATQRFFSFAIGQKDEDKLKKTFTVNLAIYGAIALIALALVETVGLWFVNKQLQVPTERLGAVLFLYHFSVFSFISTIITAPFIAIIIAHENMKVYAYISIVEAVMKLGIVVLLAFMSFDKLELYGVLVFLVSIVNAALYIGVCVRKYSECQFKVLYWDKDLLHEIIGFTGWTLFGQVTTVMRMQAITILLNQVFNPVTVAARAVATSVASQVNMFSNNFNVGLYPPIIKSYAANAKSEMLSLVFNGSKITFFLMWIFALPMFLEMEFILTVWLKNPPTEAVLFTRLALVEALILSLSLPITTAARAPGKMKTYELSLGSIQIAIFVADLILLKLGAQAYMVYVVAILANLLMFIIRLFIVNSSVGIPVKLFLQNVAVPVLGVMALSAFPSYLLYILLPTGLLSVAITVIISMLLASVCMYYLGLDKEWRQKVNSMIAGRLSQFL